MNLTVREIVIDGRPTLQITTPAPTDDLTAALFGGQLAEIVLATYPNTAAGQRQVATLLRTAQRPLEAPF